MVFEESRENMITIYYATLTELEKSNIVSDKETLSCIVEKVNKQRRNKILRCKNEKDKLRSLVAGLLLRFGLEQEGIDYKKSEFIYGEHGKPMLLHYKYRNEDINTQKGSQKVFFSLTHSDDYVACAISDETIGIDLEQTNRTLFSKEKEQQLLSMAKRICTQREYVYFLNLPKEKRIKAYVELWTRKESFAKADGRGLAIGLEQVEVLKEEELEHRTNNPLLQMRRALSDKDSGFSYQLEQKAKKLEFVSPFYTCWINENTCMSIYSSKESQNNIADCFYVNAEQIIFYFK